MMNDIKIEKKQHVFCFVVVVVLSVKDMGCNFLFFKKSIKCV